MEMPDNGGEVIEEKLGVCRIYAFGFDFRPFHLLLRWKNAHLAQPNSAFSALHQAKIIENRPERPKPDRLLGNLFQYLFLVCVNGEVPFSSASIQVSPS